jgi:quercetin dioxygenase-like cupin family protein
VTEPKPNSLLPETVASLTALADVATEAIVSRVLMRSTGGSVTLFAFAAGQELSEHTAPFDALVQVVDGLLDVTIDGTAAAVGPGEVVVMPANVPHALRATADSRMVLVMLRDLPGSR